MKPSPGVWGVDLGQCALKALRLQMADDGLVATAFDFIEYPKILSQPDADPDQLIREALGTFLSRNAVKGDTVAISVPGQSGLARFVKLPPVEEKKIADIVKFEAKQQIPFNLDEVIWDYQKIGSGEVVDGLALETEIGLFAMKRDMVDRYMKHFKDVGVEVHYIQMAPLALCNFLAFDLLGKEPGQADDGKKACVVGLDIGTDTSNMVITDGGRVIWQRPIPLGGNHFTRAITKDLKLTFAKAEHLKRNAAKSGPQELKKLLGSLKPVLSDFVGEAQRSLNFFTNTHRDASIEYMVGLGNAFRLPGLQKFLTEKLQLPVKKLDKLHKVKGDEVIGSPIFVENLPTFAVSYGLALQGLARARLLTNLLPQEIRLERLIRGKKPWAIAAAALLLFGLSFLGMGYAASRRPYLNPDLQKAEKDANSAAKLASDKNTAFKNAKGDAEKEVANSKAIVAGQYERANWAALMKFVGESIPQPNGDNLTADAKGRYFTPESGKKAYDTWLRVRRAPPPAPKSTDKTGGVGGPGGMGADMGPTGPEKEQAAKLPAGIDDLIQFNIQSVDSRFCDDLATYWKQATTTPVKNPKAPEDIEPARSDDKGERMAVSKYPAPEGKGWVVAVSGYTFHRDQDRFIRDTIMKQLAANATKGLAAEKDGGKGDAKGDAAKGGAAKGDAKGDAKGGDAAADFAATEQPVVGRVSHILLYRKTSRKTSSTTGFEFINEKTLDRLVSPQADKGTTSTTQPAGGTPPAGGGTPPTTGGTPPTTGGGAAGGGGGSGPSRSSWSPVGDQVGAGAKVGGEMAGGGTTTTPPVDESHTRTEFIILFIWKEPTPSDSLRGSEGQGQLPPASAPGGPGRDGPGRDGP